jgi:hypothetical protein
MSEAGTAFVTVLVVPGTDTAVVDTTVFPGAHAAVNATIASTLSFFTPPL